jgi:hypothetical protein
MEDDHLRPVVVAEKHGEVRDGHRPAAEILEHDQRATLAQLGLGALERALERLGPEPAPARLELELEVQDAAGRGR